MTRPKRSTDWGFPRWRGYGAGSAAAQVRICDRDGCDKPGDRPAPRAPNRPEKWWFCEDHAGEYNRNWNYFEGLTPEEAAAREAANAGETRFRRAEHWGWGGPGDGSRSRGEMDALRVLGLDVDADPEAVKKAYRQLAKENHPDIRPGDAASAERFRAAAAAYEVLRRADDARAAAA